MTPQARADQWAPPAGTEVEMIEVGSYWDIVRAPADLGECVLELLGDRSGAVIADYGLMYWFIPSGQAPHFRRLRQEIHALGTHGAGTAYVGVPPIRWKEGPRLHWRIPVGPDRYLTDPYRLREALIRAIAVEPAGEAKPR